MSNKREKGFLLPSTIGGNPTIDLCITIPDTPEYREAFWGSFFLLTRWYSWQHGTHGDTRARDAAAEWMIHFTNSQTRYIAGEGCEISGLIDVRQNTGEPCILEKTEDGTTWEPFANLNLCAPLVRLGEDGKPEYSTDGGETWTDFPPAPVPSRAPVEGQDDKCLAAANAEEVLYQLYTEFKRLYVEGATIYVIGAALISLLAILIFYPPAFAAVAVFFLELYNLWTSLVGEDYDAEREEMRCILFCAATETDGVYTFNFEEVQNEVRERWTPVTDYNPFTALDYFLSIIGEDGLNRAGATTSITEADCSGCTDCAPEFMLEAWEFDGAGTVVEFEGYDAETGWFSFHAIGEDRGTNAIISLHRVGGGCWEFDADSIIHERGGTPTGWSPVFTASVNCAGTEVVGFNNYISHIGTHWQATRWSIGGGGAFGATFRARPV